MARCRTARANGWLLAGCGALAVTIAGAAGAWRTAGPAGPRVEVPSEVGIEEREVGEIASIEFPVRNTGSAPLQLIEFRSDCACNGMDRLESGQYIRFAPFALEPGESTMLRFRKTVTGPAGVPFVSGLLLRTDDPDRPAAEVLLRVNRVLGGLEASPAHWHMGAVAVGEPVRKVFDLTDSSDPPRRVAGVRTSDPSRLTAELLPFEATSDAGRRVGRVAVTVNTDRPGPVEGMVWLLVSGDHAQPRPVHVSGRVVASVECLPGAITLPRASGAGWVYAADCVVRSTEDRPFKVEVVSTPEWASAVLGGTAEDTSRILTVIARPAGERSVRGVVRLLAEANGRRTPIDIDIRLDRPEGGP